MKTLLHIANVDLPYRSLIMNSIKLLLEGHDSSFSIVSSFSETAIAVSHFPQSILLPSYIPQINFQSLSRQRTRFKLPCDITLISIPTSWENANYYSVAGKQFNREVSTVFLVEGLASQQLWPKTKQTEKQPPNNNGPDFLKQRRRGRKWRRNGRGFRSAETIGFWWQCQMWAGDERRSQTPERAVGTTGSTGRPYPHPQGISTGEESIAQSQAYEFLFRAHLDFSFQKASLYSIFLLLSNYCNKQSCTHLPFTHVLPIFSVCIFPVSSAQATQRHVSSTLPWSTWFKKFQLSVVLHQHTLNTSDLE